MIALCHSLSLLQALSLEEEYDGTELERSTPLPLGIAVKKDLGDVDETMSVIIDAATPLPASKTQTYYTCRHNQEWVRIQVISGWGELATDNQTLGVFAIDVPPKPQGEVSVEVKFGRWSTYIYIQLTWLTIRML